MTVRVSKAFPTTVGGPGPYDTVVVTLTGATVTSLPDMASYYAANATNQGYHDNFDRVIQTFSAYGRPVISSSTSSTVTMSFEIQDMFADGTLGKAPYSNFVTPRPDAFELAQTLLASNGGLTGCTVATVTINGQSQSS